MKLIPFGTEFSLCPSTAVGVLISTMERIDARHMNYTFSIRFNQKAIIQHNCLPYIFPFYRLDPRLLPQLLANCRRRRFFHLITANHLINIKYSQD